MRAYLKIDRQAIKTNYLNIAKATNKKVLAVVKGNAYGLGIREVARELASLNCPGFVVSSLEEAVAIRKSLIFAPILVLENSSELRQFTAMKLTLAVHSLKQLKELAQLNFPLRIQLNFDIGMHRDGLDPSEAEEALKILKKSRLILLGLYGHHTGLKNYLNETEIFKNIADSFAAVPNLLIHHSASLGLEQADDFSNAVRVGGAIYGLVASDMVQLKPTVSLFAPIWTVAAVQKGESVGYEGGSKVPEDGFIYTLPIGYADGLPRGRKNIGWLDGEILVQVGNTMMNHIMLFSKKEFSVNQEVELFGEHLDLFNLAKLYKTIPYEISTQISPLIHRILN